MEEYNNNNETFEYWNNKVQKLEGELEIAKQKRDFLNNDIEGTEGQIEKKVEGYLKGKSGRIFSRLENSPENSFFRLFNVKDGVGSFEFHGDGAVAMARRVFSNDDYNVKIISGNETDAESVTTKKPGKVKTTDDGEWEVIEPIEIELI